MARVSRQQVSRAFVELMPNIIQGVHLGFLSNRTITQTQFLVMVAIHSNQRCSMRTLAEKMHVSMPTISGIVDRLAKAGYILREDDPSDRRLVMVELSAKGRMFIEQFQKAAGTRWEEILHSLSMEELISLNNIIRKLNEGIRKRG